MGAQKERNTGAIQILSYKYKAHFRAVSTFYSIFLRYLVACNSEFVLAITSSPDE